MLQTKPSFIDGFSVLQISSKLLKIIIVMTPEHLKEKLESQFKFTVQPPLKALDLRFEDGIIYNENHLVADYKIESTDHPKHYKIILSNFRSDSQMGIYEDFSDITIVIEDEPEFPVFVNITNRTDRKPATIKAIKQELPKFLIL